MENKDVVELAQRTLQANREHLHALEVYTQELEAELERFDKLIEAAEIIDESDLDVGCFVTIPGSVRATAPFTSKELLSPGSLFREDALKRNRYRDVTEPHPMKTKELEALAEAVKAESYRKHVSDTQQRSALPLSDRDAQIAHVLKLDDDGINWDRVAEKVSTASMTTRTARECKIQWLGEQHPDLNHEPWTQEEVLKVKSLAADFIDRQPDWVTISERLGTRRTPLDCMRQATSRKSHQWTTEADERLLRAIEMYGHDNWHLVARYVSEDATPSQCSNRFQKTLDDAIKHSAWTSEEDARLSAAVAAYGSSWVDVAANVPGRHNDQCRDRWVDQLDPGINKSQWSEEEDRALADYVREYKNASWRQIAELVCNGRTAATCRNRYAILQRDASTTPVVGFRAQQTLAEEVSESSGVVLSSSHTPCSKPFILDLRAAPAPPETEYNHSNQFVFLDPVVSSNPEAHKPRPPRHRTRFKTMTTDDSLPLSGMIMPPAKKRKTQSCTVGSTGSSIELRQK